MPSRWGIFRQGEFPAAVAAAALAFYIRWVHPPRIIDDAFITFRYAVNLAGGQGFVYNPGEYVLGTTTPLYTLFLTLGVWLAGADALPAFSTALNALFDAGTVVLLILLARGLKLHWMAGGALGILFAISDKSVIFSVGGMETSVFLFFLTGTAAFLMMERPALSMASGALAVLTRPDGLVLVLLAMLAWCLHRRKFDRSLIRSLLIFAVPVGLWAVFSWFYFGSPLPNSIAAKRLAYSSDVKWWQLFQEFLQHGPGTVFGYSGLGSSGRLWMLLGHIALFGLGSAGMIARRPLAWFIPVFPVAYALALSAGSPFLFHWYVMPFVLFLLV